MNSRLETSLKYYTRDYIKKLNTLIEQFEAQGWCSVGVRKCIDGGERIYHYRWSDEDYERAKRTATNLEVPFSPEYLELTHKRVEIQKARMSLLRQAKKQEAC